MTRADLGRRFDVCVIGSGAAGGLVAAHLVDRGLDVILLEQGGRVEPTVSYLDVLRAAEPAFAEDWAGNRRPDGYAWTTCNLGGGTVFYGGVMWRYREVDFDCSRYLQGDDLDVRWPFGYAALAPCYDQIEHEIGVARSRGLDPCEPPSPEAALPPHPYTRSGREIADAARQMGMHPFPTPLAINSVQYAGRQACERSALCVETLCANGSKSTVVNVYLDPRSDRPNFFLKTRMKAARLVQTQADRVEALTCIDLDAREPVRIAAAVYVIACNAIQSAVLLLRSRSRFSPQGLGNARDLLGRGLCYKNSVYLRGYRSHPGDGPLSDFNGPCSTVSMTDHYIDPEVPTGLGGLIYEMIPGPFSIPDGWTSSSIRLECLIGDRPSRRNRVYLADERDQLGLEKPVLRYESDPIDGARLKALAHRGHALLKRLGCDPIELESSAFELGSGHLHGTCRFGIDPLDSVLNTDCRLHDVENVFVADGSFMPFPGGLNPTLTIQANAARIVPSIAKAAETFR